MTTYKEFPGMDIDKLKYVSKAKKKVFKAKGNKYLKRTIKQAN